MCDKYSGGAEIYSGSSERFHETREVISYGVEMTSVVRDVCQAGE